jgi:hypothetical protein
MRRNTCPRGKTYLQQPSRAGRPKEGRHIEQEAAGEGDVAAKRCGGRIITRGGGEWSPTIAKVFARSLPI